MPRKQTYPDILDEVRQIDIAWLRSSGYLEPDKYQNGFLRWKHGSCIGIESFPGLRFLRLTHGAISYTVQLECILSNLGKGVVRYFICPATGKRCRKLYGINGRFQSRHAYPRAIYRSQAEPKRDRGLRRYITLAGTTKNPKAVWDTFDRDKFRAYYDGKPTKRYRDYLERTRKIEAVLDSGVWRSALPDVRSLIDDVKP